MIRVTLPFHLRNLAGVRKEILVEVPEPVTVKKVIDAIEARYPMLTGTIREHDSKKRRPFVRFFACSEDYSLVADDTLLPERVAKGEDAFMIVGAVAGG